MTYFNVIFPHQSAESFHLHSHFIHERGRKKFYFYCKSLKFQYFVYIVNESSDLYDGSLRCIIQSCPNPLSLFLSHFSGNGAGDISTRNGRKRILLFPCLHDKCLPTVAYELPTIFLNRCCSREENTHVGLDETCNTYLLTRRPATELYFVNAAFLQNLFITFPCEHVHRKKKKKKSSQLGGVLTWFIIIDQLVRNFCTNSVVDINICLRSKFFQLLYKFCGRHSYICLYARNFLVSFVKCHQFWEYGRCKVVTRKKLLCVRSRY